MSASSLAGATHTPSVIPMASVATCTVRSRSVPTTERWFPTDSIRRPLSTICADERVPTARPAVVSTSTNESRSHRNFTKKSFLALLLS